MENLRETESCAENWLEITEKIFNFATSARKAFTEVDIQTKKEKLITLGQRITIRDGVLSIEPNELLVPIANDYPELE